MKSLNDMAYEFYKAAFKADSTPNLDSNDNPAVNTTLSDAFANERNVGTSNQYGVGVNECNITVITGTSAIAVSSGAPALLFGLHNTSAGVVTATIVGFLNNVGVYKTVIYSLAANESKEFRGVKVGTTFTVQPSVTDVLAVEWRLQ